MKIRVKFFPFFLFPNTISKGKNEHEQVLCYYVKYYTVILTPVFWEQATGTFKITKVKKVKQNIQTECSFHAAFTVKILLKCFTVNLDSSCGLHHRSAVCSLDCD